MFNALPSFGRFVRTTSEWTSVPLALIPFGYKIERRIVEGKRQYRVSGPDLPETLARSTEHGRWIIGEHARKARLAWTAAGLTDDEDQEDTLYYADAFVGVAYDGLRLGSRGELLVGHGGDAHGLSRSARKCVEKYDNWAVSSPTPTPIQFSRPTSRS